jgi:nicotinamide mononucleotide transporter
MVSIITDWLSANYIELSGAILGLVYVFFSVRQKVMTWPAGIATSIVYAYVFFTSRFYAGMGLQIYYVAISVYGWYYWVKGERPDPSKDLPVRKISSSQMVWSLLIFIPTFIILYLILSLKTDSPVPALDALTTSLSIVATWLLARKILENWLIWIVADLVYIGLYLYKNLWPTVILFLAYEALAIFGYLQWKRSLQKS